VTRVLIDVSYDPRRSDDAPLGETHKWHAVAWVNGEVVCNCWAASQGAAMYEALDAVEGAGVPLEHETPAWEGQHGS
jgi:hypothetical protein